MLPRPGSPGPRIRKAAVNPPALAADERLGFRTAGDRPRLTAGCGSGSWSARHRAKLQPRARESPNETSRCKCIRLVGARGIAPSCLTQRRRSGSCATRGSPRLERREVGNLDDVTRMAPDQTRQHRARPPTPPAAPRHYSQPMPAPHLTFLIRRISSGSVASERALPKSSFAPVLSPVAALAEPRPA